MGNLYRAMKEDSDGFPLVEPSARGLGVRSYVDILVDDGEMVEAGSGGMSVSPDSIANLPEHRRPPSHGGTGPDSVWEINENNLGAGLAYEPDDEPATHGLVEPAWRMSLEDYELRLAETRTSWRSMG